MRKNKTLEFIKNFLNEARNPKNDKANELIRSALNDPEYAKTHTTELKKHGIKYIKPQEDYGDNGALEGKEGRRLKINSDGDWGKDKVRSVTSTYYDNTSYNNGYSHNDSRADSRDIHQKTYATSKQDIKNAKRNMTKQINRVNKLNKAEKEEGGWRYKDKAFDARVKLRDYQDALKRGVHVSQKDTDKIHPDVDLKGFLNAKKHSDRPVPLEKDPDYNKGENKTVSEYKALKRGKEYIDSQKELNKEEDKKDQEQIERYKQRAAEEKQTRDNYLNSREKEWQTRKDAQDKRLADYRKRMGNK